MLFFHFLGKIFKYIATSFIALVAMLFLYSVIIEKQEITQDLNIEIKEGDTYYSVMNLLNSRKILPNSKFDKKILFFFNPQYSRIKKGLYEIKKGESLGEILHKIISSKQTYLKITFIEGTKFKDAINSIKENSSIVKTIDYDKNIFEQLSIPQEYKSPEGLILPETYSFFNGDRDKTIIKTAYNSLKATLDDAWKNRQKNLPYKNKYELLIMASIIEKESANENEKRIISAVFKNRLQMNMKLQTDPTIIYGLGDRYTGSITKSNIKEATPYNTYVIKGLPPTPISLVGKSSIYAAANPTKDQYLYFVSKNNGSHFFSKTLKDHNRAVKKYQRKK